MSQPRRKVVTRPVNTTPSALDPYGIYGTRTANRRRVLQRRRQTQELLALLLLLVLSLSAIVLWQRWRTAAIPARRHLPLHARVTAKPVLVGEKQPLSLLVPTEMGQLLQVDIALLNKSSASSPDGIEPRQLLKAEAPLRAEPLVVDNQAFVTSEDGVLYALDWKDGRAQWKVNMGDAISAQPAALQWQEDAGKNEDERSDDDAVRPSLERRVVFAANDTGLIVAVDAGSGRTLWRRRVPAPVGASLTALMCGDGRPRLLVPLLARAGTGGGVWCLDASTGAPLWKFPAGADTFAAQFGAVLPVRPRNQDGIETVYFANDEGAVFCLNLRTGRKVWKSYAKPLASGNEQLIVLRGEPLYKEYSWGSRLFVGGEDGGLRCFNAATGQLLWTFDIGSPIHCRPVSRSGDSGADEVVATGTRSPLFFALDARDGTIRARFNSSTDATYGPIMTSRHMLVVSKQGALQVFALPS